MALNPNACPVAASLRRKFLRRLDQAEATVSQQKTSNGKREPDDQKLAAEEAFLEYMEHKRTHGC